MLKKLIHFFREYSHFGLVVLAILISLGLTIAGQDKIAHIILGATALISAMPLLIDMLKSLRHGTYGIDILAITAIVTSVLLGEYWAGMIIVLMLTGGEALEDYAEKRAKTELTSLLERAPKKAHLLKGDKTVEIPIEEVLIGNKLLIRPGDVIPVDGIITEGTSTLDESSITGESVPVSKKVGDTILSGSVNMDSALTIKVLRSAKDSQYEQIVKLVKSAAASQAPFVRLADRYSIPFTIISFVIAGTAWAVSGDPLRFLQVIVVATPCPLILAAPIALISGMSRSAKQGIIVKNGSALERLAEIKTIAFDKTGTLTRGTPVVSLVTNYGKFSKNEVIEVAAVLEQKSNHILAKAIVSKAHSLKLKVPKAKNVRETPGYGVVGQVGKKQVLVGKVKYIQQHGVLLPKSINTKGFSTTTSLVVIDDTVAGAIAFEDQLRPESKSTLSRLKQIGIKHLLMVTGDNQKTADTIAKKIGLTDVQAECLPADKLLAVENVIDKPVAFVGDGVNDAPVLTAADVGIALGARGSTAASESADVVIMLDDISRVATGVEIAKRTFSIAKQSILIGIFISIGLMFIFSTGRFAPVYGAAIQEVVDVIVIFNALRAHTGGKSA